MVTSGGQTELNLPYLDAFGLTLKHSLYDMKCFKYRRKIVCEVIRRARLFILRLSSESDYSMSNVKSGKHVCMHSCISAKASYHLTLFWTLFMFTLELASLDSP